MLLQRCGWRLVQGRHEGCRAGVSAARQLRWPTSRRLAVSSAMFDDQPAKRKKQPYVKPPVPKPDVQPDGSIAPLWLAKALAAGGVAARRKCELLIQQGRVKVNGQTVTQLLTRVDPSQDQVEVDGAAVRLSLQPPRFYLLLHKPKGFICSAAEPDQRGRRALDLLQNWLRHRRQKDGVEPRLFTVGRLDVATQGLLFLTNDGKWAHSVQHPSHGITKEYEVVVPTAPTPAQVARILQGCVVDGRLVRPVRVTYLPQPSQGRGKLRVTVQDGRNREAEAAEAAGLPCYSAQQFVRRDWRVGPEEVQDVWEWNVAGWQGMQACVAGFQQRQREWDRVKRYRDGRPRRRKKRRPLPVGPMPSAPTVFELEAEEGAEGPQEWGAMRVGPEGGAGLGGGWRWGLPQPAGAVGSLAAESWPAGQEEQQWQEPVPQPGVAGGHSGVEQPAEGGALVRQLPGSAGRAGAVPAVPAAPQRGGAGQVGPLGKAFAQQLQAAAGGLDWGEAAAEGSASPLPRRRGGNQGGGRGRRGRRALPPPAPVPMTACWHVRRHSWALQPLVWPGHPGGARWPLVAAWQAHGGGPHAAAVHAVPGDATWGLSQESHESHTDSSATADAAVAKAGVEAGLEAEVEAVGLLDTEFFDEQGNLLSDAGVAEVLARRQAERAARQQQQQQLRWQQMVANKTEDYCCRDDPDWLVRVLVAHGGLEVLELTRIRVGGFWLPPSLAPGEFMEVGLKDLACVTDPAAQEAASQQASSLVEIS